MVGERDTMRDCKPKRRKFVSHTMSQIFSWMLLPSIFKILLMESNQKFNFLISRISLVEVNQA